MLIIPSSNPLMTYININFSISTQCDSDRYMRSFRIMDQHLIPFKLPLTSLKNSCFGRESGDDYKIWNFLSNFRRHHFKCLGKFCDEIHSLHIAVFCPKSNASLHFTKSRFFNTTWPLLKHYKMSKVGWNSLEYVTWFLKRLHCSQNLFTPIKAVQFPKE